MSSLCFADLDLYFQCILTHKPPQTQQTTTTILNILQTSCVTRTTPQSSINSSSSFKPEVNLGQPRESTPVQSLYSLPQNAANNTVQLLSASEATIKAKLKLYRSCTAKGVHPFHKTRKIQQTERIFEL